MNDISNLNVDIVPLADESGRMQVLPMKGWYAIHCQREEIFEKMHRL